MVPESAIRRLCSAAVFERARKIVALGTKIHVRRCRYDDIDTVLRARVDASYSWDEAYRTSVVLDEEAGLVVDYSCDCPASRRFSGPCKHAVALALDFNASPESYDGYEANTHLSSSREITRLIERAKSQVPEVRGKSTEPGPGCVHVGVTLVRDNGFHLRLRLSGMPKRSSPASWSSIERNSSSILSASPTRSRARSRSRRPSSVSSMLKL